VFEVIEMMMMTMVMEVEEDRNQRYQQHLKNNLLQTGFCFQVKVM
jgi:hypothetical protein